VTALGKPKARSKRVALTELRSATWALADRRSVCPVGAKAGLGASLNTPKGE
jgi:hypothetical protein